MGAPYSWNRLADVSIRGARFDTGGSPGETINPKSCRVLGFREFAK